MSKLAMYVLFLLSIAHGFADEVKPAQAQVAKGFSLSQFAMVPNARQMALSDNGSLFVGSRQLGKVHVVLPSGELKVVASGLNMPSGLALNTQGDLYIAAVNEIYRLKKAQQTALTHQPLERLIDGLPNAAHHGWKFIGFEPKTGDLVVPVGAPCNVCLVYPQAGKAPFGTILSLDINALNKGNLQYQLLAQGVRNSVGFDWHPTTGELWFSDNGRDWMGDDTPPCEINRITQADNSPVPHFGFPFEHGDISETDPKLLAAQPKGLSLQLPVVNIQAHSAPLGIHFYQGEHPLLKGALLVAEHGSWNRTTPVGYRLSAYWFNTAGGVSRHQVLVNWLVDGHKLARPVDVIQTHDGQLLISDDAGGIIWQLRAI